VRRNKGDDTVTKFHAGTKHAQGSLHRGTAPKPSPVHGGSGAAKGTVHKAPTRPAVNSANYGAQKVKQK
jgi:hypothetical protein